MNIFKVKGQKSSQTVTLEFPIHGRVHEKNVVLYEIHRENWNGVNTFVHCPVQRGTTFLTGLTVDVRISVLSIP
jgi:hypothetical protein